MNPNPGRSTHVGVVRDGNGSDAFGAVHHRSTSAQAACVTRILSRIAGARWRDSLAPSPSLLEHMRDFSWFATLQVDQVEHLALGRGRSAWRRCSARATLRESEATHAVASGPRNYSRQIR